MSRRGSRSPFEAIKTEGGLLPHDLLQRIAARDPKLPGLKDADYGLLDHEREGEVVNRSWTRLLAAWAGFRAALEKEPPATPATTATRSRWLLPLFQELGFGRLSGRGQAFELDGRAYPISHEHEATHTAVHLLGARVGLDVKTQAVQGAAKTTPHGLVQDFLNRSDAHDWAIVTNGLVLRLLRDSRSITRQAYVEFDLESILDDQRYSEFRVLWLVCHESRFRREGEATCLLEQWFERGKDEGVRALDRLRGGVEEAIRVLGRGFLRHRDNSALRDALGDGRLDAQEYYRQLLRLVYRLIFLFVTEDRNVLLDPAAPEAARERYTRHYATSHLRALATRRRGGPHGDLWTRLNLVMGRLYAGCPELGLPALGSFLWKPEAVGLIGHSALANEDMLSALRMLVEVSDGKVVMPVAWAQVGADELGSVYESLLELHPRIEREAGSFELGTAAGHERKTTGSYYTPTSLVECLLDSALDPVLDAKCRSKNPEAAILETRVCDPACGSGHFLVAAARRIAKRLATVRSGDEEPSPGDLRRALRDVVGRCVYGVDLNAMAVELCKVSLWLEAVTPGSPLSYLDSHILIGNSLVGATPALISPGIPEVAFDAIEGDTKEIAKRIKKLARSERSQRSIPFGLESVSERFDVLVARAEAAELSSDSNLSALESKARLWTELRDSNEHRTACRIADAWCAAFMMPKDAEHERLSVTPDVFRRLVEGDRIPHVESEVARLAAQHQFLHWHIAFPNVFSVPRAGETHELNEMGLAGGFDVVIGNPPWEHVEIPEVEWFASRRPEIATAPNASERRKLLDQLQGESPELMAAYEVDLRRVRGANHFARRSGRFPLTARGRINTYALFSELNVSLLQPRGRAGFLVPTGVATDDSTKYYFDALMSSGRLLSLFDFTNDEGLFPAVRAHQHFCAFTVAGGRTGSAPRFSFFLTNPSQLADADRTFELTSADVRRVNPNSLTVPVFRDRRTADLILSMYRAFGVLCRDEPKDNRWSVEYRQGLFNMAADSAQFRTGEQLSSDGYEFSGWLARRGTDTYVALFDAKMAAQYNHRAADLGESGHHFRKVSKTSSTDKDLQDPGYVPSPLYYVPQAAVEDALGEWQHDWLLGFKDVTGVTSTSLASFSVVPRLGVGHPYPLLFSNLPPSRFALLLAILNSYAIEFVLRSKMQGLHLTWFLLKQLPVPSPEAFDRRERWTGTKTIGEWLIKRVLELTYTAHDLRPFAEDCGHVGPPFCWDSERRFQVRAEIEAAVFCVYGLTPSEVDFVLDSLSSLQRRDERVFGSYRSRDLVGSLHKSMVSAAQRPAGSGA